MSRHHQHHAKRPAKIGGISMAEFMLRLATRHPRPLGPDDSEPATEGGAK